jgi:endonuclease G
MFAPEQVAETERRFESRRDVRDRQMEDLAQGGLIAANPPERIALRKARLENSLAVPPEVTAAFHEETPDAGNVLLERILASNDLLNANFLGLALRAARSVGRIRIRSANGRALGYGTGFMVSPRLLLTNNHVLGMARTAMSSVVDFAYEDDVDGQPLAPRTFALDPADFFLTDVALDYSLVSVATSSQAGDRLEDQGWCQLIEDQGKVLLGELVNVIQHPGGERKRLALRQNEVVDLPELFVHYRTDTSPGSSGAPVLNDQWEVVALHHSGVPKRDAQGNILARDGSRWQEEMGDELIDWIANEGVRVSRVVASVKAAQLTGTQSQRRDELIGAASPTRAIAPSPPEGQPVAVASATPAVTVTRDESGGLAVDVSVRVGVPGSGQVASVTTPTVIVRTSHPMPVASPVEDPDLAAALAEAEAARTRPYYDAEADGAVLATYYAGLELGTPAANFAMIHELVTETHKNPIDYRPATHLYPWVDLQPNRRLMSIYSTREFEPEEVIREDFEIERYQLELAARLTADPALQPETVAAMLEAASPFNCEHVVPQSWFAKQEPMRGDLHHLFTCEWGCNSFRGNTPYFDFPDFEEKDRDQCGRRVADRFEPSAGKGAVARATLYFLTRYPDQIGDMERELQLERLSTMIGWHRAFPVTEYERHRNAAIAVAQGNRNPFIDRPELVDQVDFSQGFA